MEVQTRRQVFLLGIADSLDNLRTRHTSAMQITVVPQGRKNPLWMGLPDRLRRTRKQAGLTQRQLGHRAFGISQQVIGYIEKDGRTGIDIVEKLAAGLGIPVYWLAFGPEAHLPFRQVQKLPDKARLDPAPRLGVGIFRERYKGCGERVRQVREQLGLTLLEVGEAALLSDQAVLNTELGATVPRLETIELIAVALDVAPGWLAYGDDDSE